MSKQWQRRHKGLNITPLIDVVFLLLAFLLVCSRMDVETALDIILPEITEGAQKQQAGVVVAITQSGTMLVDNNTTVLNDIPALLAAKYAGEPLSIRADSKAPAGVLVELMHTLAQHNISAAQIITMPKD